MSTPAWWKDATPTGQLILENLVSRWRLGEPFWPIPRTHTPVLRKLVRLGLVTFDTDVTPRVWRVHLTPLALTGLVSPTYKSQRGQIKTELRKEIASDLLDAGFEKYGGQFTITTQADLDNANALVEGIANYIEKERS